jgi:ribonuclease P protein subunit POP4
MVTLAPPVVESRCKGNIGTEGIVLQETQNTFKIITSNDRILTIPKGHTVFQFALGDHLFTLYGNQLRYRSSERTTRKFKDKFFFNL